MWKFPNWVSDLPVFPGIVGRFELEQRPVCPSIAGEEAHADVSSAVLARAVDDPAVPEDGGPGWCSDIEGRGHVDDGGHADLTTRLLPVCFLIALVDAQQRVGPEVVADAGVGAGPDAEPTRLRLDVVEVNGDGDCKSGDGAVLLPIAINVTA